MSTFFDYNFYLTKPMEPKSMVSHDVCFSEEESDSSHSTQSFQNKILKKREMNVKEEADSDNDSLIEYPKKNKANEKKKNLYKTELCRNWEETNQCRYGSKCQYAHGAQDLREIERHPKYKTQKCRTFDKSGACPYGARCTFRHFSLPGEAPVKQQQEEDDDDFLLPTAESLLPHQLLFDLDSLDEPRYNQSICKSFFRPWLF